MKKIKEKKCFLCGVTIENLKEHVSKMHNMDISKYKALKSEKKMYKLGVARLKKRTDLTEVDLPYVPKYDENWKVTDSVKDIWEEIAVGIQHNEPIYIGGPTGCGKTESVMQLAAVLNQPVRRIQLNRDFKVSEFVGRPDLQVDADGNSVTVWRDGVLTEAIRNNWWLLLDEVDQAHPDVVMKLQGVLEGSPLVLTENFGEVVELTKKFRIISTANTFGRGDDSGFYAGAKVQNEATLDRYGVVIKANYAKKVDEIKIIKKHSGIENDTISTMVDVANKVRTAFYKEECFCTFSTRKLINWAKKIKIYGDVVKASKISVINRLDREDHDFVFNLIQRHFGGSLS